LASPVKVKLAGNWQEFAGFLKAFFPDRNAETPSRKLLGKPVRDLRHADPPLCGLDG